MVFSGRLSKCRVINAELDKPESWKETCFPVGVGPPEPVVSTPGIQEHRQNCLVGPTPNGKHHKYACTPASFHESGQEVACSPEQMQGRARRLMLLSGHGRTHRAILAVLWI